MRTRFVRLPGALLLLGAGWGSVSVAPAELRLTSQERRIRAYGRISFVPTWQDTEENQVAESFDLARFDETRTVQLQEGMAAATSMARQTSEVSATQLTLSGAVDTLVTSSDPDRWVLGEVSNLCVLQFSVDRAADYHLVASVSASTQGAMPFSRANIDLVTGENEVVHLDQTNSPQQDRTLHLEPGAYTLTAEALGGAYPYGRPMSGGRAEMSFLIEQIGTPPDGPAPDETPNDLPSNGDVGAGDGADANDTGDAADGADSSDDESVAPPPAVNVYLCGLGCAACVPAMTLALLGGKVHYRRCRRLREPRSCVRRS